VPSRTIHRTSTASRASLPQHRVCLLVRCTSVRLLRVPSRNHAASLALTGPAPIAGTLSKAITNPEASQVTAGQDHEDDCSDPQSCKQRQRRCSLLLRMLIRTSHSIRHSERSKQSFVYNLLDPAVDRASCWHVPGSVWSPENFDLWIVFYLLGWLKLSRASTISAALYARLSLELVLT
jgi:hypothetical protein